MTRPKAIFFDIGNVLVRLRTEQFLDGMARACDARWERHSILASIRESEGPHVDYEKGRIDGPGFHAHLQGRFGLRLDYGAWLQLWNHYFEPNRPMEALLARLRGQARFFALSNTNAEHLAHLKRNFRLFDGLEKVIASNEVGARKPEKAMFEAALAAAGVQAEEALYLDDLEPFILEARKFGWRGFHYTFNDGELRQALRDGGFELPSLEGKSGAFC